MPVHQTRILLIALLVSGLLAAAPIGAAKATDVRAMRDIVQQLAGTTKRIGVVEGPGLPGDQRIMLPDIQFEFDSDRLSPAAHVQLDELAKALQHSALGSSHFAIHGHTDSAGSIEYNRLLSERRALSVSRYLQRKGVDASRLVEVGFGETHLLDDIPGRHARNRRVEIVRHDVASTGTPTAAVPASNGRALIIAVGDYRKVSPALPGTVQDATNMRAFAMSHLGFRRDEVKMLVDEEATRSNILDTAERVLIGDTRPGETVFLYFSGHGYQQFDQNNDEADRLDETLVPYDAFYDEQGTLQNMITDDEIAGLFSRLNGRRVLFVVDACHAGTSDKFGVVTDEVTRATVKSPTRLDGSPLRPGKPAVPLSTISAASSDSNDGELVPTKDLGSRSLDLTVWTAVKADQKALMLRNEERRAGGAGSWFTENLLNGFRESQADLDNDGSVSRDELISFLQARSSAYCEANRNRCGNGLTPQMYASGTGAVTAFERVRHIPSQSKDISVRQVEAVSAASDAGVDLAIASGTRLEVGSVAEFVVTSQHDGFLILLDISPDGNIVQLYPNRFTSGAGAADPFADRIQAGASVHLPGEDARYHFRAQPPAGDGVLFALVTEERSTALDQLTSRHKDLLPVARPRAYLSEMIEALRSNDQAGRRTALLHYTVANRSQ